MLELLNFDWLETRAVVEPGFNQDVDGAAHCRGVLAACRQLLVGFHQRNYQIERRVRRRTRLFIRRIECVSRVRRRA